MSRIFLNYLMFKGKILINKVVVNFMITGFEALEGPDGEKKCAKKCTGMDSIFPCMDRGQGLVNSGQREQGSVVKEQRIGRYGCGRGLATDHFKEGEREKKFDCGKTALDELWGEG